MGKTEDTETATYEVLSRLRFDGERYVPGDTVDLTAKQHAQAFASGAVSEKPVDPSGVDGDEGEGKEGEGATKPKPPAKKRATTKKATTKKAAPKTTGAKPADSTSNPTPGKVPEGAGPPPKPES